jgi:hypothetical protein
MAGMTDFQRFGIGAGLGGIGAGLGAMMMGGGKDPYGQASKYYDRIPDTLKPYFQPYINAGQGAMGQLQGQYGNLVNDPSGFLKNLGQGYQQSPGYDWQMKQAQNAATNAAAAGGMAGSPQHQQQAAQLASNIANQDYYNYLQNALGVYGTGLQGLQGINQMGFGASTGLGENLANSLMNQGNMAFSGQASRNQAQGSQWGDLLGGLGSLMAFL